MKHRPFPALLALPVARNWLTAFALLLIIAWPTTPALAAAPTLETRAQQAILIDLTTNTVLLEKNADQAMYPSSMSKLMTAYVAFKRLQEGGLHWEDKLTVSERAWRTGGSKMFVGLNEQISVRQLLQGIITQSGNDACITLAEGVAGSEEGYVTLMNEAASDMGLKHSHFTNTTGLPDPRHYTTARDLSIIAGHILKEFPDFYPMYSVRSFTHNNITQPNRNPLLGNFAGADGLKTGHTDAAGYGLVGSAVRDGRRLLMVVNGLPSLTARAEDSARLLDWGFREFASTAVVKKDAVVTEADVWLGNPARVKLVAGADLVLTIPRAQARGIKAKAVFNSPIANGLKAGTQVGTIVVSSSVGGGADSASKLLEVPLVVASDTTSLSGPARVFEAFRYLLWGSKPATAPEPAAAAAPAADVATTPRPTPR
ncbi:MAG: D-alanyl-D-alanine carboxypeptidase [Alphaproteobacteria bacterium]|nr:D-alanyl-D-alanine carboxypeptidase [Alphaproteobacteria bacterium]